MSPGRWTIFRRRKRVQTRRAASPPAPQPMTEAERQQAISDFLAQPEDVQIKQMGRLASLISQDDPYPRPPK